MSKTIIIKEQIRSSLESINELSEHILSYDKVPQIDMDIVLEKIRTLYNDFHTLNKLNAVTLPFENEIKVNQPAPTPTSVENFSQSIVEDKADKKINTEKIDNDVREIAVENLPVETSQEVVENENDIDEGLQDTFISIPDIEPSVTEEIITEVSKDKVADPKGKNAEKISKENSKQPSASVLDLFGESTPTLSDKLKSEKPSVLEKIAEKKEDKSLATRMQKQPIKDLKKAIGINEKFLFINELFNGNLQDYNTAIDFLNNNCNSLTEAKDYIEKLKIDFNWDMNKISISVFEGLVERRFL